MRAAAHEHIGPCTGAEGSDTTSPCTPDFTMVRPIREVTADDIVQANLQMFVNEVVKDEDARIGALAQEAAEEAAREERERLTKEAALAAAQKQAEIDLGNARQEADKRVAEATEAIIRDVAERAARLGQAEQLKRDQEVIERLLSKQADLSKDFEIQAKALAVQQGLKAEAQVKVTEELGQEAKAVATLAAEGVAEVATAKKAVQAKFENAKRLSAAAVEESAKHIMQQDTDVRTLKLAARSQQEYAE